MLKIMFTISKTFGTCSKDQLRNIWYRKIIQIKAEYAYIFRITKSYIQKRANSYHIILRCEEYRTKNKEKCQVIYKSKPFKITTDFSAEILRSKRSWNDVLQNMNRRKQLPAKIRSLLPTKLSFTVKGAIKLFQDDKYKLKQFLTTNTALQNIFK